MSHADTSWHPAAAANWPDETQAITGTGELKTAFMRALQVSNTSLWWSMPCSEVSSLRLCPDEKTGPEARSTKQRMEGSLALYKKGLSNE